MDPSRYHLSPDIVTAIHKRFASPPLAPSTEAVQTLALARRQNPKFDRWVRCNTHPHRVEGYISAVISLKPAGGIPGDASAEQLECIADLADTYSFGEIRVTHLQNLVLAHVAQDKLEALWKKLEANGLGVANHERIGDIVACPGLDYCSLANARSIPIAQKLSARFADLELQEKIGPLRVNISGCINACGHHHVGHIGLLGVDKRGQEFFQITLGGRADDEACSGEILGAALPEDETIDAIARIIDRYLTIRQPGEAFVNTLQRLGHQPFKEAAYDTV